MEYTFGHLRASSIKHWPWLPGFAWLPKTSPTFPETWAAVYSCFPLSGQDFLASFIICTKQMAQESSLEDHHSVTLIRGRFLRL